MERYKIVKGEGMGCLMSPPGHATLDHSVEGYSSPKSRTPDGYYSLDYLLNPDSGASPGIADQARRLLARPLPPEPSEAWVRYVYGYYRDTWARSHTDNYPGPPWFCQRLDEVKRKNPDTWPTRSMAYRVIREFYLDHEPREDLIANPGLGYGSWPCVHCGVRVQYEARHDAYCQVSISYGSSTPVFARAVTCPEAPDGRHDPHEETL